MIFQDIADARILVELHNRLSFAEAAKMLGIPPATVSRRLMRMESRAGLRLFDRTTRSVCPTEAGALAVNHAARMISECEAADLSLASMRDAPVGTVRITTPSIFGQALLGPVVTEFLDEYVHCGLQIDLSDAQTSLLEDGYDAAIRIGPVVDEFLIARPVGQVRAALYRRAVAPDLSFEDLQDSPLALLHRGQKPEPSLQLTSVQGETRLITVKPRLVCMNPWLLLEAAVRTDAVAVLPELIAAPEVRLGRLKRVTPGWFARQVPVNVIYPSQRIMRPSVRAFVDIAVDRIPRLISNIDEN